MNSNHEASEKGRHSMLKHRITRMCLALLCVAAIVAPDAGVLARSSQESDEGEQKAAKIPPDQLDSLVAPIALYPDQLLAQALAASTYPLEIIQLQQWLGQHKDLKDQALADAVKKQDWDPSVQGLAGLPDVVKRLTEDIKWTTDLGNAFLAQQSDVMDAVQRMRKKAKDKGLKSNEQMKVETQTAENKQVIVIQQANPQVIQVPSYDPVVVYGAPAYPYPPVSYPPPPPSGWAVAGGMALSFGVGVAMGAMWSGGWGYNCGWHGGNNNVYINNNNNFNRNVNVNGGNRNNINSGGNTWQHNPQHRGGTPYSNKATANKFGGTTAGSSRSQRQANARQNIGQEQRSGQQLGGTDRGGANGPGDRAGTGGADRGGNRPSAGTSDRAGGSASRDGEAGRGGGENRGGEAGRGGGGDRVGNRSVSQDGGGGSRGGGGFSGSGSGSNARASSSRGASSMGGSRGGSRGGGGGRRR